jgi:hypothetical protein
MCMRLSCHRTALFSLFTLAYSIFLLPLPLGQNNADDGVIQQ